MPTINDDADRPQNPVRPPLNSREITEVLIKHYNLHAGKYDLLIEFQIGTAMLGPSPDEVCPTAMVGVSRLGLVESITETPNTVDAAIINPPQKKQPKQK